jgi:hypothetical protein
MLGVIAYRPSSNFELAGETSPSNSANAKQMASSFQKLNRGSIILIIGMQQSNIFDLLPRLNNKKALPCSSKQCIA